MFLYDSLGVYKYTQREFLTLELPATWIPKLFLVWIDTVMLFFQSLSNLYCLLECMFCTCFFACSPNWMLYAFILKEQQVEKWYLYFSLILTFWVKFRIFHISVTYVCISLSGKFAFILFLYFSKISWLFASGFEWVFNYGNQSLPINPVIICFCLSYFLQ